MGIDKNIKRNGLCIELLFWYSNMRFTYECYQNVQKYTSCDLGTTSKMNHKNETPSCVYLKHRWIFHNVLQHPSAFLYLQSTSHFIGSFAAKSPVMSCGIIDSSCRIIHRKLLPCWILVSSDVAIKCHQRVYAKTSTWQNSISENRHTQIAKFLGPSWGPPGSCRPQMGSMLAPWTLLLGQYLRSLK